MSHTAKSISLSPNSSISTGPIMPAETPQSRCYPFVILENTNSFLWVFALQRWGNIFNHLGHSLNWREVTLIFFYHVLRNVFFHIQIYLFDIFYWHPEWWQSLSRIPKRSKVKLRQTQMWTAAWRVGDVILTFLLQHGKILRPLCSLLRSLDKHQQQLKKKKRWNDHWQSGLFTGIILHTDFGSSVSQTSVAFYYACSNMYKCTQLCGNQSAHWSMASSGSWLVKSLSQLNCIQLNSLQDLNSGSPSI